MKAILATVSNMPDLNAQLQRWASNHIWGDDRGFGPCMTMGVTGSGKLTAVVVYHNYQDDSGVVELSVAATSQKWLTRKTLHEMFMQAFDGLRCQLVVMRASPKSEHIKRMLKAYGFQCYIIPRLRGRYEDELIFTLTDNDWRTNKFNMRLSNGKVHSEASRPATNGVRSQLH